VPLSCGDVGRQPQIGRTARPRSAADWAAVAGGATMLAGAQAW